MLELDAASGALAWCPQCGQQSNAHPFVHTDRSISGPARIRAKTT